MFRRLLILAILILFSSGCATTGKISNNQVQQLQNRINHLEAELERKNQEITFLGDEIEKMQDVSISSYKQNTKSSVTPQLSTRQIQTALKNAGFYKGTIDGKMGQRTKEAIKAFQKAHGLRADGVVGKRTSSELRRYLRE